MSVAVSVVTTCCSCVDHLRAARRGMKAWHGAWVLSAQWLRIAVGGVCICAAGVGHAEVVEPDTVLTAAAPLLVFDTLVVSGTLLVANEPSTPGGGVLRCIVVTNGDFVLAPGGVISQSFDIAQVSSNGADGVDGQGSQLPPGHGQPGCGYGRGGNGGVDGNPYLGYGVAGGNGGAGGNVGGSGGHGGMGDNGVTGMSASDGGMGGNGGDAGLGASGFTVMVVNTTLGGGIVLADGGSVWLHGIEGGAGGRGGAGGTGGLFIWGGYTGYRGGAGGNGGAGGHGGAGGMLQLVCSNGYVVLGDGAGWCDGKNGGAGGAGGAGGQGGSAWEYGTSGSGGRGGNGHNGGSGGNGGALLAIAPLIVHNGLTAQWARVTEMTNSGCGGSAGPGGAGGAPGWLSGGVYGTAGVAGQNGQAGRNGVAILSLPGDTESPVCWGTPVLVPSNDIVLSLGEETLVAFSPTNFSDNVTAQDSLRHTIQIADIDNPLGAPIALMSDGWVLNRAPYDHLVFVPPIEMLGRTSCVRFITCDVAGNVTTNVLIAPRLSVVYRPLEADFTLSPQTGYTPLTVQFYDQTRNGAQHWQWDFNGDGFNDSTNRNPSYVYQNAGQYTVRLSVSNWHGGTMTSSSVCIRTNIVQALCRTNYVAAMGGHTLPFDTWARAATNLGLLLASISNDTVVIISNGVYRLANDLAIGSSVRAVEGCGNASDTTIEGAGAFSVTVNAGSTLARIGMSNCVPGASVTVAGTLREAIITRCGWLALRDGTLTSCLIANNIGYADVAVTSVVRASGTCYIRNSTIWGNTHDGVYARNSNTHIHNSIVRSTEGYYSDFGYVYLSYSCVETPKWHSALGAGMVVTAMPGFVGADVGDYHLLATSPCIDAGENQPWMAGAADLDGNPRISGGRADMGCYELIPEPGGWGGLALVTIYNVRLAIGRRRRAE